MSVYDIVNEIPRIGSYQNPLLTITDDYHEYKNDTLPYVKLDDYVGCNCDCMMLKGTYKLRETKNEYYYDFSVLDTYDESYSRQ